MPSKKDQALSLCQLALSVLMVGTLVPLAALIVIWELGSARIVGGYHAVSAQVFMLAGVLIGIAFMMLPSGYYGLMRLKNRPAIDSLRVLKRLKPGLWIFTLPALILLGTRVSQFDTAAALFLPPIHLLAVGIPTVWILSLAVRGLPTGSSQRFWGVFSVGITIVPLLIMVCELFAGLFFLVIFAIIIVSQPELLSQFSELVRQAQSAASLESLTDLMAEFMQKPLVFGLIMVFIALIVPIIEELLKPLGVWVLFGRRLSPSAGFTAGMLSGAGYGLIENLLLSGNAQDWSILVLARIGTTAVHILTAGMMGWAIVQLWSKKRYLRLGLAYLAAVLIHGLWNGLTVLSAFRAGGLLDGISSRLKGVSAIAAAAPYGLMMLAVGCFLILLRFNQMLRINHRPRPSADRLVPAVELENDDI